MRSSLLAFAGCLVASATLAQPVTGPYVSLGAGVDFLQNEIVTGASPFDRVAKADYRFNAGFAGQVSLGYGLGNGFRFEVEGDYANNGVRKVGYLFPVRGGGHEQQYGGFVNGLYDFDLGLPVTPYVGAGVGYQEVELDGLNFGGPGVVVSPTRTRQNGDFAYQGIAGVAFPLDDVAPGLALTAEYRFIGVVPQDYTRNTVSGGVVVRRTAIQFSDTFNHEILLGARYALYTPPPPAAPMAPVAAPPATPARTYLVFFDWDKSDLTGRARQIIHEAADASTHVQTTRIEVNGYTDLSGTAQYNQGLSVRRAKAVQGELIRDGVPAAEIAIHGFGESNPLVPTAQGVREPQNRRVEIILR